MIPVETSDAARSSGRFSLKRALVSALAVIVVAGCSSSGNDGSRAIATDQATAQPASQPADLPTSAALASADVTVVPDGPLFPRDRPLPSGILTVYEPQIEEHVNFKEVTAWSAAAYQPDAGERTYGAVKYRARFVTNFNERTVTVYEREVLETYFPEVADTHMPVLDAEIRGSVRTDLEVIPLDVLLAYLSDDAAQANSVDVLHEPPAIIHLTEPTMMVRFDGEPILVPVAEDSQLMIAINTNWDLFYSEATGSYSLLLGDGWVETTSLEADWRTAGAPDGLEALPEDDRWARVRAAMPGTAIEPAKMPKIIVATKPTELIVTDGAPRFENIKNTPLTVIANTSSDVIFDRDDRYHYFLTSGRWFRAKSLEGPWQAVTELPAAFADIPVDHPRAHVRASVPGTSEANFAVIQAQVPQTAAVSRDAEAPTVRYANDAPVFEMIQGTGVARATNTNFDVLKVGNLYYLCHEAVWFTSANPTGPWTVAETVPGEIYAIPAASPSHHVTYVTVYESTPSTVYVGYTSGYHHSYISFGVVVYGSGYYWPPYYNPYLYPWYPSWYYYPYPHTYGYASYYHPVTGTYGHGHYAYGPYGGYWGGERYNPRTGRYGQGAYAWDYNDAAYAGWSYSPRTDIGVETQQAIHWSDGNSYESWGETVVSRGDEWVRSERVGTEDGFRRNIETSRGGQGVQVRGDQGRATVFQTGDGDLYAGANGNVFRHSEEGGWERRQDGDWQTVDPNEIRQDVQGRANELTPAERAAAQDRARGITSEQRQAARDRTSQARQDLGNQQRTNPRGTSQTARSRDSLSQYDRLDRAQRARTSGNQRYRNYQNYRGGVSRGGRRGGFRRR